MRALLSTISALLLILSSRPSFAEIESIPIGVLCALSGESSYGGEAHLSGISFAVDQFNSSPYGTDFQVSLISRDDGGKPSIAEQDFRDLTSEHKVWAVLGSCNSSNTLAIAPIAQQERVPLITSISAATAITRLGDNFVFRTSTSNEYQMRQTVDYLVDYLHLHRFAIIFEETGNEGHTDAYGVGLKNDFLAEVSNKGVSAASVLAIGYVRNQKDFLQDARNVVTGEYEAVGLFGLVHDAVAIVRALRSAKSKAITFGGTGIAPSPFVSEGGDDVDGTIVFSPFYPLDSRWRVFQFTEHYHAAIGTYPDTFSAQSYDAARVLLEALRLSYPRIRNKSLSSIRIHLRDQIAKTNLDGVTGRVAFNERNESEPSLQVLVADAGRLIPIRTRDRAAKDRLIAERTLLYESMLGEGVLLLFVICVAIWRWRYKLRSGTLQVAEGPSVWRAVFMLTFIIGTMGVMYWAVPNFPQMLAAMIVLLSLAIIGNHVGVPLPHAMFDFLDRVQKVLVASPEGTEKATASEPREMPREMASTSQKKS